MEKWDNPMEKVIFEPDKEPEVSNKRNAFWFLVWSAFMIATGFFISLVIQGHIVIR